MSFDLLLQDPDGPSFGGADEGSAALANEGRAAPTDAREFLGHAGDPDGIDQGWGVLWPSGRRDLLDAVARLAAWRQQQIDRRWAESRRRGPSPRVANWEIPRAWGATDFLGRVYDQLPLLAQPKYLLILGDFHEISLELQQDLMSRACVGRLCFRTLEEYAAYVTKLLTNEQGGPRSPQPRLLLWSSSSSESLDGAVDSGHERLVVPTAAAAVDDAQGLSLDPADVCLTGPRAQAGRDTWDALRGLARETRPSILLSLSHGVGKPGWSAEQQREQQGTMLLSRRKALDLDQVGKEPFLPGGIWFSYACFGAGTPAESGYAPWLRLLESTGYWSEAPDVLGTLAKGGAFVARQPQVALANPDGPLAVVAHADLAFSYAYRSYRGQRVYAGGGTSPDGSSPPYVLPVLAAAAAGKKVGLALEPMTRTLSSIDQELLGAWQADAAVEDALVRKLGDLALRRAELPAGSPLLEILATYDALVAEKESDRRVTLRMVADAARIPTAELVKRLSDGVEDARRERVRLEARGHGWMARQDVRGFVLLGDPAASLRVGEEPATPPPVFAANLFGFTPTVPRRDGGAATPSKHDPTTVERAIHDLLAGELGPARIAQQYGIERTELERLRDVYVRAGFAAIKAALGR